MTERPPPFHPHTSLDGTWRWDGQAWVPVQAPPTTAANEQPAAGTSSAAEQPSEQATALSTQEASEKAPETSEERQLEEELNRTGWPMIGGLIAASLVVLAAIIGVALLAYRAAGSPPPNAAVTTTPSTPPVDPNSLTYRYLAGVTVGAVRSALQDDGFACQVPTPPAASLRNWRCDRRRGSQQDVVQVWAVDKTHVHVIDVTTVAQSGPVDGAGARQLQTRLIDLVYSSSVHNRTTAANWAEGNRARAASTSIGGVTLRSQNTGIATFLEFDAGQR